MTIPTGRQDEAPDRATAEDLLDNLKAVMHDVEALLHATEGLAGEKIAEVRARAEETLGSARKRLQGAGTDIEAGARSAARYTDAYVRRNPWAAVAIAAGVGYALGLLGRRR